MERDKGSDMISLIVHKFLRGGVIHSTALACKMAAMILEDAEGAEEAALAQPFEVVDLGDAWEVTSHPISTGPAKTENTYWQITIKKHDAAVANVGRRYKGMTPKELGLED